VPHVSSAPLFAVFCWLYRHEEHFSTLVVRSSRVKNLNLSLEFHPPACVLIPTLSRSKAASLLTSLPTPDPVPYDATCFKLPHTLAKTHGISLLLPFSTISIRYPKTSNSAPTQGANGPSLQPTFRTPLRIRPDANQFWPPAKPSVKIVSTGYLELIDSCSPGPQIHTIILY
jgi:hypothetical protein